MKNRSISRQFILNSTQLLATLAIALTSLGTWAGSENNLFVPNQYAPLSSYKAKTTTTQETLSFNVKAQVLQYITSRSASSWVAHQATNGVITLLNVTSSNNTTGVVTLSTNRVGKFVYVAAPFTNDLPIVTHWRQSLNTGRGGFEAGASDGIGSIDFNPSTLQVSESTDIYDTNPTSPYTFNSAKYALFSNDPTNPTARVPGYERYIGENYSIYKITDRMAVYLSLKSVEQTGFPLLHRNHPWAFHTGSPAGKQVGDNLPALQVVHGFVSVAETDKPTLATYILPPLWDRNAASKYPVIFNGQYDNNQNFALEHGLDLVQVIADLQKNAVGSSIAVLWNGGGSIGPLGVQQSLYFNAAYLFYFSEIYARADLNRVITMGKSRGGITALTVAANPSFDNYKVKYAITYSPAIKFGEQATQFDNTTAYPGALIPFTWSTGYKYMYQTGFIDPLTGLKGRQLFLQNVTALTDPGWADAVSPIGDWVVNGLKARGVSVLHSAGTHDSFIPYTHQVAFHDRLVAAGVNTEFNVGFRFGHNYFADKKAQVYSAMRAVMTGVNLSYSGTKYFQRASETGAGFDQGVQVTPQGALLAEMPKQVFRNQKVRLSIVGAVGVSYALIYFKIDDALWESHQQIAVVDQGQMLTSGLFNGTTPLQGQVHDAEVPATMATGRYIYVVMKSTDLGQTSEMLDLAKIPQNVSPRLPVFEVLASEPTLPALDLMSLLSIGDRGWGLSSH